MVDISNDAYLATMARMAIAESTLPHVLMRPNIFPDGNMWCALYGKDLQEGVAGFGKTPAQACADFDKNWTTQTLTGGA